MLDTKRKSLLVRADFVLAKGPPGDERVCKRWRRVLAEALPRLLGFHLRSPGPARARLHEGDGEARYTAWLRIPVERRPGRKRARRLKERLRNRLEAALLPINGRVLKVGLRRCAPRPEAVPVTLPVALQMPVSEPADSTPLTETARSGLPVSLPVALPVPACPVEQAQSA
jgi:hypothetical protein